MLKRFRSKIFIVGLITFLNLILGIHVVLSVLSINEVPTSTKKLSTTISTTMDIPYITTSSTTARVKTQYDYYFRIDYTITRSVCQSVDIFNRSETINSIEQTTIEIINQILGQSIIVGLRIFRINTKFLKIENIKKNALSIQSKKSSCGYILELLVGIDFPSYCNDMCRSIQLRRMTVDTNLLDDLSLKFPVSNSQSSELSIIYYIQNFALYRSVKFLEEIVFIQSIIEDRYISVTILDSYAYHTLVTMEIKGKSLFQIKKGLYLKDSSSIYVSFLFASSNNLYLRHEDGRLKLSKNDETHLFYEDATFRLIFDDNNGYVSFQITNNWGNFFLALDSETNTRLIVTKFEQNSISDKRFYFKIISAR